MSLTKDALRAGIFNPSTECVSVDEFFSPVNDRGGSKERERGLPPLPLNEIRRSTGCGGESLDEQVGPPLSSALIDSRRSGLRMVSFERESKLRRALAVPKNELRRPALGAVEGLIEYLGILKMEGGRLNAPLSELRRKVS